MTGKEWTKIEDMGAQIDEMLEFLDEISDPVKVEAIKNHLREAKNEIDTALTS